MREYSLQDVPPSASDPTVSILIVNYRSYGELGPCLSSIQAHEPDAEVIVVDWESERTAVAQLQAAHPRVTWLCDHNNLGFGAGVNRAAQSARATWLLLLNPDAVLDRPISSLLIDYAKSNPAVGVIGPRILDADGRIQASARRFPGASAVLGGRSTWLTRFWPRNPFSRFNLLAAETEAVSPVDWVSGACMLVRRSTFNALGGFDEGFFLYWEDADLCRRLLTEGWVTVYHPGAVIQHAAARSSRHTPTRALFAFHRSAFRYYWKHSGFLWRIWAPLVWIALKTRLAALWALSVKRRAFDDARLLPSIGRPIRVLRIVARLNIGGPAVHVAYLSRPSPGFESLLVTGHENLGEGSMIEFVRGNGVEPLVLPELVGDSSLLWRDARALWKLIRIIRRFRPDIVETHTAKAGFLGRLAGALTGVPVRIHTFHGHVLHGYYSQSWNLVFRMVERILALMSTRLVAVSMRVKQDLVEYGIAPDRKIEVVPLGLELSPYLDCDRLRFQFKEEMGLARDAMLVGIVGRIYPIKNHALFIDAAALVSAVFPKARFVVVGDGLLRPAVEARARGRGIAPKVIFTSWRHDMPRIYADLDVLVVSSNNEGTPFAGIEAMASGVPVVGTRVGGMSDLVTHGRTGLLVPPKDAAALAAAVVDLLGNIDRRMSMGLLAREDAAHRFDLSRLVRETEILHRQVLTEAGVTL